MESTKQSQLEHSLHIRVAPAMLSSFLSLFTAGISLRVQTGGNLKELICDQLGVAADYFENRIQTIFLNFKAVDEPEKAIVNDGAIITLSAAMPGLVGATMRKGGTFAGFRSSISCTEDAECPEADQGWITLKLLNMVARELGPQFLADGVYVDGARMVSFLKDRVSELKTAQCEFVLDDKAVSWEQVNEFELPEESVYLVAAARK